MEIGLGRSGKGLGEDWEVIVGCLPDGWEEQARLTGALRRTRRFGNPERLLRTLLIHLAEGCSLRETAVRAQQGGLAAVSDVAVMKRLRASEEWLRWMAFEIIGAHRDLRLPPAAKGLRVRLVDATTVSEPGSTGTDWRLHYALELTTLSCDFFELTDVHGGEGYTRLPVSPGDLILGDRAYATPAGIAHVVQRGGEVLVRMKTRGIPLETPAGRRFNLLARLRRLRRGEIGEWPVVIPRDGEADIPGRICAVRRSRTAADFARKRLRRRCSRKGRTPGPEALQATEYVFVFTTLDRRQFSAAEVMALYRGRWQIETCFKRLKSVMGFGHLPKHDPQSCRAWLHGKLLVAFLAERLIDAARFFSPWGYPLQATEAARLELR